MSKHSLKFNNFVTGAHRKTISKMSTEFFFQKDVDMLQSKFAADLVATVVLILAFQPFCCYWRAGEYNPTTALVAIS